MSNPEAVIHDIGYQRYDGARLGRGYAVRSLLLHSLRTAYGLGRSAKAKIFPWLIVTIVAAVAVVAIAVHALAGQRILTYLSLVDQSTILVLLFCAVIAPELVSRDLRNQILPLYFSRPLRRADYALAKLAAIVGAAWLLLAGPLLLMFAGASFVTADLSAVWDELGDLLGGLAYAAIVAAVVGSLALLISSLIRRRAVAAGAVVGVFLVTAPVAAVLETLGGESARQLAPLLNPISLLAGVQRWLFGTPEYLDIGSFGPVYGVVTVLVLAGGVGLLLLRYRRAG